MQQVQQLQQLQHHSNTLEHELRTARRSGAADDSKRVTDHVAVDESRRGKVQEGQHSAVAKSGAHVCGQAGMKLRKYLGDIDEHKYLPTYTQRLAAAAASPYTGKQCHTHARAASRGIALSPHIADTWLVQGDL